MADRAIQTMKGDISDAQALEISLVAAVMAILDGLTGLAFDTAFDNLSQEDQDRYLDANQQ